MPLTSAEKMAALRARQKAAAEAQAAEDAYVAEQVEITRRQIEAGVLSNDIVEFRGETTDRLQRAERYARYRWRGVQDGSIASL